MKRVSDRLNIGGVFCLGPVAGALKCPDRVGASRFADARKPVDAGRHDGVQWAKPSREGRVPVPV